MKRILYFALATAMLFVSGAFPAEPDSHRSAEQLLELTRAGQAVAMIRSQIEQLMTDQLKTLDVPESMHGKLEQYEKDLTDLIFNGVSYEQLKPGIVEIYVSTFTTEELDGLVAFYSTPVGRAYAEKLPALTTRMVALSQARMQELIPRVQELNNAFIASLAIDAAAPPSSPNEDAGSVGNTSPSAQTQEVAPADFPDLTTLGRDWSGKMTIESDGTCFLGPNHETHQTHKVRYAVSFAEGGRFTLAPMSANGKKMHDPEWSGQLDSSLALSVSAPGYATCNKVPENYVIVYLGKLSWKGDHSMMELNGIDPACGCKFTQTIVIKPD